MLVIQPRNSPCRVDILVFPTTLRAVAYIRQTYMEKSKIATENALSNGGQPIEEVAVRQALWVRQVTKGLARKNPE